MRDSEHIAAKQQSNAVAECNLITCKMWVKELVVAFHDDLQILSITASRQKEWPSQRTGTRRPKKRQTNAGDAHSCEGK